MTTAAQLATHREARVGHGHRMLGSAAEAGDAGQETRLPCLEGLDGRASLRARLCRIATSAGLGTLAGRERPPRPGTAGSRASTASTTPAGTTGPSPGWPQGRQGPDRTPLP